MVEYRYCFIRDDLSEAQQIIQMAHAVERSTREYPSSDGRTCHIVLFRVTGERGVLDAESYLVDRSIPYSMFYDSDLLTYTAMATCPVPDDPRARKQFKQFTMY